MGSRTTEEHMNATLTSYVRSTLTALLAAGALAACGRQAPLRAIPTAASSVAAPTPAALPALTVTPVPTAPPTAPTAAPVLTVTPVPTATASALATPTSAAAPQAAIAAPTVLPRLSADGTQVELALPAGQTPGEVAVAPDGHSVLYTLGVGYSGRSPLYSVPMSGGVPRLLADGLGDGAGGRSIAADARQHFGQLVPSFQLSPSGKEVVYRTPDALYLLPLDGGTPTRLSAPVPADSGIYGYHFRSDGRWLVYDVQRFDPWDSPQTPTWGSGIFKIRAVYSVALPGGPATLLATAPTEDGAIALGYAFEPQMDTLVYVTDSSDGEPDPPERRYWRVPLTGGDSTPLPAWPTGIER